jgi:ribosomal protein S18 acetylase RimI-like enzyme
MQASSLVPGVIYPNAPHHEKDLIFAEQAYPQGQSEPVGCIVCKLDKHHGRERGYIAMLSVAKTWRKRGIGKLI